MANTKSVNWGRSGHLTDEQSEALASILKSHRDQVEVLRYSAESPVECALRFLRARKFDLEKTDQIILEALEKFKDVSDKCNKSIPSIIQSSNPLHVLS